MRINRETLLRIAQDTVAQRARAERDIQAVYLCGSVLGDDYLLGGTADIDLVMIHIGVIPAEREIVRLTEDVHLDIAHHLEKDYRRGRQLRQHPWLGPTLFDCKPIYDLHHLLDFTQASVRGQFNQPEQVLNRARSLSETARQGWYGLSGAEGSGGPQEVLRYLRSVEAAVNAVALLSGPPLTERRLLMNFPARAQAVGSPGLHAGLLGLLGAGQAGHLDLPGWLPEWQAAVKAAGTLPEGSASVRLHPARLPYYQKALEAMLKRDEPRAALWPLLRSWTVAAKSLEPGTVVGGWQAATSSLGLQGAGFPERLAALDAYLDTVEETLEKWGRENGAA